MNWMRLNSQPSTARQRARQQRLGEPGHAFDERVLVAQHHHQRIADRVLLPDDHLADAGDDPIRDGSGIVREFKVSPFARNTACISREASSGWAACRGGDRLGALHARRATLSCRLVLSHSCQQTAVRSPAGTCRLQQRQQAGECEVRPESRSAAAARAGGGKAEAFRQSEQRRRRSPGPARGPISRNAPRQSDDTARFGDAEMLTRRRRSAQLDPSAAVTRLEALERHSRAIGERSLSINRTTVPFAEGPFDGGGLPAGVVHERAFQSLAWQGRCRRPLASSRTSHSRYNLVPNGGSGGYAERDPRDGHARPIRSASLTNWRRFVHRIRRTRARPTPGTAPWRSRPGEYSSGR